VVVCSDLHFRLDVPRCRGESQEDWIKHQFDRFGEMVDYANDTDSDIYVAGDIFHRAGNPEYLTNLLVKALAKLKGDFYIMPGNHDLRYREEDHGKSSYDLLQSLVAFGKVRLITERFAVVPYGDVEPIGKIDSDYVFLHTLTFEKEKDVPYGVQHYETANSLLKRYSHKYIIVGDQHKAFHVEKNGRHVINCGSMSTQSLGEVKYPHSFFHIADEVKQVKFTTPISLVSDKFIKQEKDSEGRITAMVEQLAAYKGRSLDFLKSLEMVLTSADLSVNVKSIGNRWIEEVLNEQ
jgi:DNA repair exonuclease SbcCD nuclease subunit